MRAMQLRVVKATLSAVVDAVQGGERVAITRHGKTQAVIVGMAEWERLSNVGSLGRLLMAAPIEPGDVRRSRSPTRRSPV
jgi:prevent-host-death family protein